MRRTWPRNALLESWGVIIPSVLKRHAATSKAPAESALSSARSAQIKHEALLVWSMRSLARFSPGHETSTPATMEHAGAAFSSNRPPPQPRSTSLSPGDNWPSTQAMSALSRSAAARSSRNTASGSAALSHTCRLTPRGSRHPISLGTESGFIL